MAKVLSFTHDEFSEKSVHNAQGNHLETVPYSVWNFTQKRSRVSPRVLATNEQKHSQIQKYGGKGWREWGRCKMVWGQQRRARSTIISAWFDVSLPYLAMADKVENESSVWNRKSDMPTYILIECASDRIYFPYFLLVMS